MHPALKHILFKGVGAPVPPSGFVFFVKPDGTYWTNASGAYYLKAVA